MLVKDWRKSILTKIVNQYGDQEGNALIQLLLSEYLDCKPSQVSFHENQDFNDSQIQKLNLAIEKLLQNEPIQYVLGKAYFWDYDFIVNENVLIPRPETEELVDWIKNDNPNFHGKLIDIGTGSGCIAISLKKIFPKCEVFALDVSEKALEVAQLNSQYLNANINFINHSILDWQNFNFEKMDLIISNPPYVPNNQILPSNVLKEPHIALFSPSQNPILFYQVICEFCKKHLNSTGQLYFEIHEDYVTEIEQLMNNYFEKVEIRKDINGKYRMANGKKLI